MLVEQLTLVSIDMLGRWLDAAVMVRGHDDMFEGLRVQPSTVTENDTVPSGTVSLKNKFNDVVPLLTFTECKTIPSATVNLRIKINETNNNWYRQTAGTRMGLWISVSWSKSKQLIQGNSWQ